MSATDRFLAAVFAFALATAAALAQTPVPTDPLALLAALPPSEPVERGVRAFVRDDKGDAVRDALLVVVEMRTPKYTAATAAAAAAHPGDAIRQAAHAAAHASTRRFPLDQRGVALLPRMYGSVFAMRGDTFAMRTYAWEDGQPLPRVELVLRASRECVAEVVDDQGQPAAGVPLALVTGSSSLRATTDEQGRAPLRTFGDAVTDQTRVRLLVPTSTRIEVPAPAAGGVGRLSLPACGRVHAIYRGALLTGSSPGWLLRVGNRSFRPTATGERDATFAFVEAGVEGEIEVTADSSTTKSPIRAVRAGATTEVEAVRDESGRCVAMRLLGEDGQPLRSCSASIRWTYPNGSSSSSATANAEGWLELAVPGEGEATLWVAALAGGWYAAIAGAAEIALAATDKGRIERGEVRLVKPPVALVGQVVDVGGRPLPGIRLRAGGEMVVHSETDADGRFEFVVPGAKPTELNVAVMGNAWYFLDPVATHRTFPTDAPARLALQAAGRVRFAAPGLERGVSHGFSARLEPASGDGQRIDVQFSLDREFLLLPAGHWHYVIEQNGREVHRLDDLRVDAGIEVHDPRFMAFDWRAFATLVTVHVEDRNGQPFDACTVWLRNRGSGRGTSPSNGVCRWLGVADGSTVSVEPRDEKLPKYQLGDAAGEHWVRIGAGPRLEVRVEPRPELPPGAHLVARIAGRAEPVPLGATGTGAVWLDRTGDRQVQLAVTIGDAVHDLIVPARNVDVATGGSVLTFPGGPPLQAAIDRLAPK